MPSRTAVTEHYPHRWQEPCSPAPASRPAVLPAVSVASVVVVKPYDDSSLRSGGLSNPARLSISTGAWRRIPENLDWLCHRVDEASHRRGDRRIRALRPHSAPGSGRFGCLGAVVSRGGEPGRGLPPHEHLVRPGYRSRAVRSSGRPEQPQDTGVVALWPQVLRIPSGDQCAMSVSVVLAGT